MPITGPASYLPTINQFLAHWQEVNDALGEENPLVLAGAITRVALEDRREELSAQRDAVTSAGIVRSLARETLRVQTTALLGRLVEFNERVRADLPDSIYTRVLPAAFNLGEAEGVVREALREMLAIWGAINAMATPPAGLVLPMVLREGLSVSMFETALEDLRTAFRTMTSTTLRLRLARERRNDLQNVIQPILKNYRQKVPTVFVEGDALVDSLPRLSPEPGHTPAAVTAHGSWDAPSEKGKITWGASSDADLESYEVRAVPGDSYNADDETVLATVLPNELREFLSDFALSTAGLTCGFKVYVILNTGNEKGSEPVYVTRPG